MLNLDPSVFVITLIIFFLWKILDPVFFRPVGKIIDERENKIISDNRRLQELTTGIEEQTADIETQLRKAQKDSTKIREELIQKGEILRREMVEKTREESMRMFSDKMAELDRQIVRAESELEKETQLFVNTLKETILA